MILFVFEGEKAEPKIYNTIKSLYFENGNEDVIYIFNSNIYGLYDIIRRNYSDFDAIYDAVDVISILRSIHPDSALKDIDESSQIDQIFLFFDYDFQHVFHALEQHPEEKIEELLDKDNQKIAKMLDFFDNETEMGKLYINYPMVESLMYTKRMPDNNYSTYQVSLKECHGKFKHMAESFTDYHGFHGLLLDNRVDKNVVKRNWELLKSQNVKKANYLCSGEDEIPVTKNLIFQKQIFNAQIMKHDSDSTIGVLNSFPLFIYEYFK